MTQGPFDALARVVESVSPTLAASSGPSDPSKSSGPTSPSTDQAGSATPSRELGRAATSPAATTSVVGTNVEVVRSVFASKYARIAGILLALVAGTVGSLVLRGRWTD